MAPLWTLAQAPNLPITAPPPPSNAELVEPLFWVALGLAVLVYALARRAGAVAAGRWLALLVAGLAAMLQLIAAGPLIRYQHFTPLTLGRGEVGRWAAVVLVLQLLLVAIAFVRRGSAAFRPLLSRWPGARWVLLLAIIVGTSATLSASPVVYGTELLLAGLAQLAQLGTLVLALLAMPERWCQRVAAEFREPLERDRYPLFLAIATTVFSALLAVLVYERHPHIPDEVAYLLQARTFARGALTLPVPPVLPAFDVDITLTEHGRWFSAFPPGWPAFLAVGALFGVPWLVNPVLGGLNVLLAAAVARRLYDRPTARLTALLLAASPWHLFLAMSFMSQTVTLTVALLAALGVARWRDGDSWLWLVVAGAAAGWAGLTRPLDGVLVAGATGLWLLLPGGKVPALGNRIAGAVAYGVGMGLTGILTLLYNRALTGHPLRFPVMVWSDRVFGEGTNALGFGPNRGFGWTSLDPFPGHGLRDVVVNANLNTFQVNTELLGWSTGSLVLLAAFLLLPRGPGRRDVGVFLAALFVAGLHAFYWFSGGPDFGARYWFLLIFPLLLLTARGALRLEQESGYAGRVLTGALTLSAVAFLVFVPWRAIDKYFGYRRMHPEIPALAEVAGFGRSLVLVQGLRFPDFAGAATYNPLTFDGDGPLYAFDQDRAVRATVRALYPDRPVWVIEGPSRSGGGYRILAGPIPPGAPIPALPSE
jgi:hypothetical protein